MYRVVRERNPECRCFLYMYILGLIVIVHALGRGQKPSLEGLEVDTLLSRQGENKYDKYNAR